jgi:2,4-dienoyl-CoA reductase (NADPH2)
VAAERGHRVTLFDAADEIGGQFNLAKKIPGKEEFHETLRYFRHRIEDTGVELRLSTMVDATMLGDYDHVVLATGVMPRAVDFPGADHRKVIGYLDVLGGRVEPGARVAIVGAGGIGFDVAEYLVHHSALDAARFAADPFHAADTPVSPSLDLPRWMAEWGVDPSYSSPGGLTKPQVDPPTREVWLLQRSPGKPGARLGKTTGWIHRAALKAKSVKILGGVEYLGVDDEGLRIRVQDSDGGSQEQRIAVDHIVVCAGQVPRRDLYAALQAAGANVDLIGGADVAAELDAKRAIAQGSRLAARL